ncbi:SRPBCC domain-containing protein [Nocardia sp. NPDC049707]|uniref:SRPBCC domain-containing protein n=1 Tax=Nocardia sp. NPDC049707 TaxID=3154735 RepID=UPI0034373BF4
MVPDEQVVQLVEFETDNSSITGEMTITIDLVDADGGTRISAVHDGLPEGVPPDQNELG